MEIYFLNSQQWKTVHSLLSSVRSDGSLQVRLCLADESGGQMVKGPGGEREGMRGSDPCRCLNQCRCAGRNRLRCCMHTERRIESWCRTEVPWETVCVGVIHSIWSWTRSLFTNAPVSGWYLFSHTGRNRKWSGFVGRCIRVYIDSRSAAFVCISGGILHMPAPYTVTLKEKVFLFYLFASS